MMTESKANPKGCPRNAVKWGKAVGCGIAMGTVLGTVVGVATKNACWPLTAAARKPLAA